MVSDYAMTKRFVGQVDNAAKPVGASLLEKGLLQSIES